MDTSQLHSFETVYQLEERMHEDNFVKWILLNHFMLNFSRKSSLFQKLSNSIYHYCLFVVCPKGDIFCLLRSSSVFTLLQIWVSLKTVSLETLPTSIGTFHIYIWSPVKESYRAKGLLTSNDWNISGREIDDNGLNTSFH